VTKNNAAGNNYKLHFISLGVVRGSNKNRIQSFVRPPIHSTKVVTELKDKDSRRKEASEGSKK
jgi:hypothetical protein